MTAQSYSKRKLIGDLEEFLYRLILVPLVAFLPSRLAYGLACLRGGWRYRLDSAMRQRIIHNLETIFGDQYSYAERTRLTRDFFRRKSCEAIDVMRLSGRGRSLKRLVEVRGLEHIQAALAEGKGAIICCAHYGSFNSAFSLIGTSGLPITVVGDWRSTLVGMRPLQRFMWRLVHEKRLASHRQRPNIEPMKEGVGTAMLMVDILRSNEVVALAVEPPLTLEERARAVVVDFLGRQMLVLPGSVTLAGLTGSPLLALVMSRLPDWRHQVLEILPLKPPDGDAVGALKYCMEMLEEPIRQYPAYWDWWSNTQSLSGLGLLPSQEQLEEVNS